MRDSKNISAMAEEFFRELEEIRTMLLPMLREHEALLRCFNVVDDGPPESCVKQRAEFEANACRNGWGCNLAHMVTGYPSRFSHYSDPRTQARWEDWQAKDRVKQHIESIAARHMDEMAEHSLGYRRRAKLKDRPGFIAQEVPRYAGDDNMVFDATEAGARAFAEYFNSATETGAKELPQPRQKYRNVCTCGTQNPVTHWRSCEAVKALKEEALNNMSIGWPKGYHWEPLEGRMNTLLGKRAEHKGGAA